MNMVIADLLITIVYFPRMIVKYSFGRWWFVEGTFGLILCRMVLFLHHATILVSVFLILGATVDRFCAIMFPLRNKMTRKVARNFLIATWLVAAVVRFQYLITPTLKPQGTTKLFLCASNLNSLFGSQYREVYDRILLSIYSTCLLTTIWLYTIVIIKLKKVQTPGISNITAITRKEHASKKLLKMMIAITFCFIVCWFCYFFAFDIFPRPRSCYVSLTRFLFAHANSALNPIILCFFEKRFRANFKRVLQCMMWFRNGNQVQSIDGDDCVNQSKISQNHNFVELAPHGSDGIVNDAYNN